MINQTKHAYLIMAHTDAKLLQVLIKMLDDVRNDIYLHIDKKWKDFPQNLFKCSYANLYILDKRIDVLWGHYSIIEAELLLFSSAYKPGRYSYYHLLSGADLPIKTQDYIHEFFYKNEGKEFICYWMTEDHYADALWKMERYAFGMKYEKVSPYWLSILLGKIRHIVSNALRALIGPRKTVGYIQKGANWVSVTERVIGFILSSQKYIQKRYRWVRNGDEIFLQSLVYNSPFQDYVYSMQSNEAAAMRKIDWEYRDPSPNTYTLKDKECLLASDMLFARKFSTLTDKEIIQWVYETFSKPKD